MATVAATNNTKGILNFVLDDVDDETTRLSLNGDETVLIHCTGLTANACSVQVLCYVGDNTTAVALKDSAGTSTFTADFALGFTAPAKCSITAKLTVDGGGAGVVATFTR